MFLLLEDLLLEGVGLAETNLDLLVGVLLVNVTDGISFALHLLLVKWVKIHLGVLLSVKSHSGVLSDDGGWENLRNTVTYAM